MDSALTGSRLSCRFYFLGVEQPRTVVPHSRHVARQVSPRFRRVHFSVRWTSASGSVPCDRSFFHAPHLPAARLLIICRLLLSSCFVLLGGGVERRVLPQQLRPGSAGHLPAGRAQGQHHHRLRRWEVRNRVHAPNTRMHAYSQLLCIKR